MIKTYDELREEVLKLLSQPEKCNGFFRTHPARLQFCREEKNGFTLAIIREAPYPGKATLAWKYFYPADYNDVEFWSFGKIQYHKKETFQALPMLAKIQCMFETMPIGLMNLKTKSYDNAYKEFLRLINTPYERKDAE